MAEAAPVEVSDGGEAAPKKKGGKALLFGILGLLLIGGGAGGFFFWKSKQASAVPAEAPPPPPMQFHPMEPAFIVNFPPDSTARFLQVELQIGTRDAETLAKLKEYAPALRNDLVMLFAAQNETALATREGKEKLRADALATVRKVVKSASGKPETVEAVFFTSFVMQ